MSLQCVYSVQFIIEFQEKHFKNVCGTCEQLFTVFRIAQTRVIIFYFSWFDSAQAYSMINHVIPG